MSTMEFLDSGVVSNYPCPHTRSSCVRLPFHDERPLECRAFHRPLPSFVITVSPEASQSALSWRSRDTIAFQRPLPSFVITVSSEASQSALSWRSRDTMIPAEITVPRWYKTWPMISTKKILDSGVVSNYPCPHTRSSCVRLPFHDERDLWNASILQTTCFLRHHCVTRGLAKRSELAIE